MIVGALIRCGATVQSLAPVGKGCPDLLVGFRGRNLLLELKDGDKKPSARKLNAEQAEWHGAWKGQVAVVETVDQAVAALLEHRPSATTPALQAADSANTREGGACN